ncbi:MAG: hypothetical protein HC884_03290 [Chloroflexaceae bacterium]|nr:hypothetical protein [Chloroflexaceae bacterium]
MAEPLSLIDEAREGIAQGHALSRNQAQALLDAYNQASSEVERLQHRVGDLEFHFEVFQHLVVDRKVLIEKLAELGLQIYSAPDPSTGSWHWAWRWREDESHSGYESSISALIAAVEALLKLHQG